MKTIKAFTLIELLVVISIITILIGIMLPALGAARKTAIRLQCSSNVRQIMIAVASYRTETEAYPYQHGRARTISSAINTTDRLSSGTLITMSFKSEQVPAGNWAWYLWSYMNGNIEMYIKKDSTQGLSNKRKNYLLEIYSWHGNFLNTV